MTAEIRSCGPGKFETVLDSYVYGVSLDGGCDEEVGDAQTFGWFGLLRNGLMIFRDDDDQFLDTLNDAEQAALTACAGVIICEDCQGFVTVTYYVTDGDLEQAWTAITLAYEEDEALEDA